MKRKVGEAQFAQDIAFLQQAFPPAQAKKSKPNEDDDFPSLLPEEVLLYVFSFLDLKQLSIIARVCRGWYKLAYDPSLYKEVYFTFPLIAKLTTPRMDRQMEKKKIINRWDLDETEREEDEQGEEAKRILQFVRTRMSKTRVLHLGANLPDIAPKRGKDISARTINEIVKVSGSHLQQLNISGCQHLRFETLLTIAAGCPQLTSLNVNGCTNIFGMSYHLHYQYPLSFPRTWYDDETVDEDSNRRNETNARPIVSSFHALLFKASRLLYKLEDFAFEEICVGISTFLPFIKHLTQLQRLTLGIITREYTAPDNIIEANEETLLPLLSLRELRAYPVLGHPSKYPIGNMDLNAHYQFLQNLIGYLASANPSGLSKLRIRVFSFDSLLSDALSKFDALEVLSVQFNTLNNPLHKLATPKLRKLVVLPASSLASTSIFDSSTVITPIIQSNESGAFPAKSTLRVLKLPQCDQELLAFVSMHMPNLRTLMTEGTGVWGEGVDTLDSSSWISSSSSPSSSNGTSSKLTGLTSFFEHCSRNLKSFQWKGWTRAMNDQALSYLADNVGSEMKRLTLINCPAISDEGISSLSNKLTRLEFLELHSMPWRLVQGQTIRFGASLTSLTLFCCRGITDANIGSIVDNHPCLEVLILNQCKVGKRTCQAIGRHVGIRRLEMTSFKGRMNNAALADLGDCISLRRLNLTNLSLIDEEGLRQMAARGCLALQTLRIENCPRLQWTTYGFTEKVLEGIFDHPVHVMLF